MDQPRPYPSEALEFWRYRLRRRPVAPALPATYSIATWSPEPVSYRVLYRLVGEKIGWIDRLAYSDEELKKLFQTNSRKMLVLRQNGLAWGWVEGEIDASGWFYIDYFGIAPTRRGHKLAVPFLGNALRQWREQGHDRFELMTTAWDAPAARRVYEKLGFELVESGIRDQRTG